MGPLTQIGLTLRALGYSLPETQSIVRFLEPMELPSDESEAWLTMDRAIELMNREKEDTRA